MNNQIKEDMKSILDNRPELVKEVNKVAEVAGYLWQKGWAERNGGNITINITEFVDDEIRRMQPISEVRSIGGAVARCDLRVVAQDRKSVV